LKALRWVDRHFEEIIMATCLMIIVIVMGIQIFMRYVIGSALSFPEELCRYLFIWLSFIGISYSVRCGNSLKIDILETLFPKIKTYVNVFGNLVFLAFVCIMIWKGSGDIGKMALRSQLSPALGIPMWWVYVSFLVGCCLTAIRIIQRFILEFLESSKRKRIDLAKGCVEGGEN